jgi:hypothetical protein
MPSYRVTMTIGRLRAGTAPQAVLPEAVRAVGELTTVEASDVGIVSGMPRVIVRFTGDDSRHALGIGAHALAAVSTLAEPLATTVTERVGGRWYVVR